MVIDGHAAKAKDFREMGSAGPGNEQGRKQPAACFRPLSIREEGTLHPVRLRCGALFGGAAVFMLAVILAAPC